MVENITLTPQLIEVAHNTLVIPNLIILFILANIVFLAVGHSVIRKSHAKIWLIWFISFIFQGMLLLAMVFLPNLTQSIINLFSS